MYQKEEHYKFEYQAKKGDEWVTKFCYPTSKEGVERNKQKCKDSETMRFVKVTKLYPFSMNKNQHNFELIRNICYNRMADMEAGEIPFDEAEYDRLSALRYEAEEFWGLPLPVAWLPYEEWARAKELAMLAIEHRAQACIEHGRPDLVNQCGYEDLC